MERPTKTTSLAGGGGVQELEIEGVEGRESDEEDEQRMQPRTMTDDLPPACALSIRTCPPFGETIIGGGCGWG